MFVLFFIKINMLHTCVCIFCICICEVKKSHNLLFFSTKLTLIKYLANGTNVDQIGPGVHAYIENNKKFCHKVLRIWLCRLGSVIFIYFNFLHFNSNQKSFQKKKNLILRKTYQSLPILRYQFLHEIVA